MRIIKVLAMCAAGIVLSAAAARAGDFDWLKDLNVQAQVDPSGFKAQLEARFKVGDAEITTVLSNVRQPADAYMVLRLGEMSGQPLRTVEEKYRTGRNTGWGNLARSLGIKPGSAEFHALKRGHDLGAVGGKKGKGRRKEKGHGKKW